MVKPGLNLKVGSIDEVHRKIDISNIPSLRAHLSLQKRSTTVRGTDRIEYNIGVIDMRRAEGAPQNASPVDPSCRLESLSCGDFFNHQTLDG